MPDAWVSVSKCLRAGQSSSVEQTSYHITLTISRKIIPVWPEEIRIVIFRGIERNQEIITHRSERLIYIVNDGICELSKIRLIGIPHEVSRENAINKLYPFAAVAVINE